MLTKFETESDRVKGIAFHPIRHWILASLHSGLIQLWDYHMKALLEKYEGHESPVRGICFHPTQPLFSSGGDDNKVKLWNFKQRKCLFSLEGHLDYVRSVCFHHELPWLMSASDDQTIRIWNWQSRNCLAIVTGHNHYIMCAQFHDREDFIVSASLDQTVRVWDFKNLRQKFYAAGGRSSDILLGTDVVVKFVLEGHDRGVNWASFHQGSPYIVSAADDRSVRLWRYTDSRAWEVETMRGHSYNVSAAVFHPNLDVIISNSEDKSLKVWDLNKRSPIYTYRRENDRFWVLAIHPSNNLIAAGCDSGLIVFKLERERVSAMRFKKSLFYAYKKHLNRIEEGKETTIASLRSPGKKEVYMNHPKSIQINPFSHTEVIILLQYDTDEGNYTLVTVTKNSTSAKSSIEGTSLSSCFVNKDKFAVLTQSKEILIMDYNNSIKKKLAVPLTPAAIFTATVNKIMIYAEDTLHIVDVSTKMILCSVRSEPVKQVVWSPNSEYVALICKEGVTICSKSLEVTSSSGREAVKSGIWDPLGVFIYSTGTHIKYLLLNRDTGIIKSLESPVYLTHIAKKTIEAVNRSGEVVTLPVNDIEYRFKMALLCKRYNEVRQILESGGLTGMSVVKYLQEKGFPEVALYFVKDEKTRFNLAIQAGMIEIALNSAYDLQETDCWAKLSQEALKQGNNQIVEMTYQKNRNLDKLSLLYLITGNVGKLGKMQQIAQSRNDKARLFHNALIRGDIEKRAEMLAQAGQVPLAYVLARTHNLNHLLGPLQESLGEEGIAKVEAYISRLPEPSALHPMVPILNDRSGGDQNWPLHSVITSQFELLKNQTDPANPYLMETEVQATEEISFVDVGGVDADAWGGDFEFDVEEPQEGWGNEDFEVPETTEQQTTEVRTPGLSLFQKWSRTVETPGELTAAGCFQQAMQQLTRTVGISNFAPLKSIFMEIYASGLLSLPLMPHLKPMELQMTKQKTVGTAKPNVCVSMSMLTNKLKNGYKLTNQAKFAEARDEFLGVLHKALFLCVSSEKEEAEVRELIKICTEYISCMRLELQRQQEIAQKKIERAVELGYYMSLCKLQPGHQSMTMRSAIALAYKYKNFITCTSLCKRFLELVTNYPNALPPNSQPVVDKHRKLLNYCQQNFTNDLALGVELPESAPDIVSTLCQRTFTQVSPAVPTSRCPFCFSLYHKEYKGCNCDNCLVAQVGLESLGLRILTNN